MRIIAFAATLALSTAVIGSQPQSPESQSHPATYRVARALTCFKEGEDAPVGFTKICYYDCLGSRVAITISSTSLCPLTIQR